MFSCRDVDSYQWKRGQGSTMTEGELGKRPTSDHTTTNDGYYVYTDINMASPGISSTVSRG